MTKSKGLKQLENILIFIGALVFLFAMYVLLSYEYNFHYQYGVVSGFCDEGTRKGVNVEYMIEGEKFVTCDQRNEDKRFKIGDKVYLRVINGFNSFARIDAEKTRKESGVPPQKPAD